MINCYSPILLLCPICRSGNLWFRHWRISHISSSMLLTYFSFFFICFSYFWLMSWCDPSLVIGVHRILIYYKDPPFLTFKLIDKTQDLGLTCNSSCELIYRACLSTINVIFCSFIMIILFLELLFFYICSN